jgi:hypothetical protein
MADNQTPEVDLDNVIDRLLEGELRALACSSVPALMRWHCSPRLAPGQAGAP